MPQPKASRTTPTPHGLCFKRFAPPPFVRLRNSELRIPFNARQPFVIISSLPALLKPQQQGTKNEEPRTRNFLPSALPAPPSTPQANKNQEPSTKNKELGTRNKAQPSFIIHKLTSAPHLGPPGPCPSQKAVSNGASPPAVSHPS